MINHIKDIQMINIDSLKEHPKNPNKHSEDQIKRLADILEYQGWRYPIKVSNQSGFITSGHGRLAAAKLKNWSQVPVSYQDYESEDQEYADIVSDNAIADWSDLDLSNVNLEIENLGPDFDINMLGIKNFNLDFDPGTIEEQGKLDQKKLIIMQCPHCGESFEQKQAKIIA